MARIVYVEEEVRQHPRVRRVLEDLGDPEVVTCDRYGEVFNRRDQSFRLQKRRPALILAAKHGRKVLPVPRGYGIGAPHNYYFSHLLNCPYDCRYCFLQGMYRSAHHVFFVNFEEFTTDLDEIRGRHRGEAVCFFSGYDGDSLALESITGFVDHFLDLFAERPDAWLELRTKSGRTRELAARDPLPNVVVAYSLSSREVAETLEYGAPSLDRRLEALETVAEQGWPVGLRFDPLIHHDGFREGYRRLFQRVFDRVSPDRIHSVSLGPFRVPAPFFRRMERQYPEEPLLAGPLVRREDGLVSYRTELEGELLEFCRTELLRHLSSEKLFSCVESGERIA
ncbi:MAG: radical SAM protein [Thermoanaerobaculia bacterium]|nr:radical SAM protein [Thermoanaerobaculia bacterium]